MYHPKKYPAGQGKYAGRNRSDAELRKAKALAKDKSALNISQPKSPIKPIKPLPSTINVGTNRTSSIEFFKSLPKLRFMWRKPKKDTSQ